MGRRTGGPANWLMFFALLATWIFTTGASVWALGYGVLRLVNCFEPFTSAYEGSVAAAVLGIAATACWALARVVGDRIAPFATQLVLALCALVGAAILMLVAALFASPATERAIATREACGMTGGYEVLTVLMLFTPLLGPLLAEVLLRTRLPRWLVVVVAVGTAGAIWVTVVSLLHSGLDSF